ncbi:MAG: CPBP family intramembrane metalloprotease [Lachnospiraceae bacterium]|nr:CPBP family intramembrane metalloprotease [Lachnospiraceae bacterium]
MKGKKRIVGLGATTIGILCFQILYYQLTVIILQGIANRITGLSNDCYLMIHHTVQFLLLFIPTILISKALHIDFGYHIHQWKKGLGWFGAGVVIELLVALVIVIFYGFDGISVGADTIIFQLFFSGLGEEIPYRALPLVILPLVWGKELTAQIGAKYEMDIDVLISAVLFSIRHISFQFGHSGISYSWTQLIVAFLIGVVLGKMYKRTNSIWACMIAHGIFNIIAVTL